MTDQVAWTTRQLRGKKNSDVTITQEPLWDVNLPGGLYTLIHFQGTVRGIFWLGRLPCLG